MINEVIKRLIKVIYKIKNEKINVVENKIKVLNI